MTKILVLALGIFLALMLPRLLRKIGRNREPGEKRRTERLVRCERCGVHVLAGEECECRRESP